MAEHSLGKGEVESSILSASSIFFPHWAEGHGFSRAIVECGKRGFSPGKNQIHRGSNSVVESQPSKLLVAGSIPVSRSKEIKLGQLQESKF